MTASACLKKTSIIFCAVITLCLFSGSVKAQTFDWTKHAANFNTISNGYSKVYSTGVAYDADQNMYAIGWFYDTLHFADQAYVSRLNNAMTKNVFIAKYDPAGNRLWCKIFPKCQGMQDESLNCSQIKIDLHGDIIFSATCGGMFNNEDMSGKSIICKMNDAGTILWVQKFDYQVSFTTDNAGNVYTAFRHYSFLPDNTSFGTLPVSAGDNFYLGKLNNNGAAVWLKEFPVTSSTGVQTGLSINPGNTELLLCNTFYGSITINGTQYTRTQKSGMLARFDVNTGNCKKASILESAFNSYFYVTAADWLTDTSYVVTGGSYLQTQAVTVDNQTVFQYSDNSYQMIYTMALDTAAHYMWHQRILGGTPEFGYLATKSYAVKVSGNNIYIAGGLVRGSTIDGVAINYNYYVATGFIARYSTTGAYQSVTLGYFPNAVCRYKFLEVTPSGKICATGDQADYSYLPPLPNGVFGATSLPWLGYEHFFVSRLTGPVPAANPDLTVAVQSVTPATLTVPGNFTVNFTETNTGAGAAAPHKVLFYLSYDQVLNPGAGGDILLGEMNITNALAAGANTGVLTKALPVSCDALTGDYFIIAVADGGGTVTESNENNNLAFSATHIIQPAASAGNDVAICPGGSVQLHASGGNAYVWTPATGLSNPNVADPVASPAVTTVYHVSVLNGTCLSDDAVQVMVVNTAASSVTITASSATICTGASVTFTATPLNATNASYQWKVNGVPAGTNSSTFTSTTINNNDVVKVFMTADGCGGTQTSESNGITMSVGTVTPAVTVSASQTNICTGASVVFTAAPVNGGTAPSYQWQVNEVNTGTNSPLFTTATLVNNNRVRVIMTGNAGCASQPTATSNTVTMSVGAVTPAVSITVPSATICANTAAVFTATPVNGGAAPSYQWSVNGVNQGANSAIFSSTVANNAQVKVVMTSSADCVTQQTAASNTITMTVQNQVIPSVSITVPSATICAGHTAVFTATALNAGTAPVYQWKKNGINTGTNSAVYSSNTLLNNDVISITVTGNSTCSPAAAVPGNQIVMHVNATGSIVISGNTTVIEGTTAFITAIATGDNKTYQWQDSTATHNWQNIALATGPAINYNAPATGTKLRCLLYSTGSCGAQGLQSNVLSFTVESGFADPNAPNGGIVFYPNPATDFLRLTNLAYYEQWETLTIVGADGQSQMPGISLASGPQANIDVRGLKPGIYVAIARRKKGKPVFLKFIKL